MKNMRFKFYARENSSTAEMELFAEINRKNDSWVVEEGMMAMQKQFERLDDAFNYLTNILNELVIYGMYSEFKVIREVRK